MREYRKFYASKITSCAEYIEKEITWNYVDSTDGYSKLELFKMSTAARALIPSLSPPSDCLNLIAIFYELRDLVANSDNPIPISLIEDWQRHSYVQLERWERDAILQMDRAFRRSISDVIKWHSNRHAKKAANKANKGKM